MTDNTFKQNTFVLKEDGKIYYVNTPEANDFVDQDDVSTRFDQAGYDEALQSAIANGIEVENQDKVFPVLWKSATGGYRDLDEFRNDKNKLYPLNCKVEVIEEWIPGQGYNSPSKEIARVTFEQPKKKDHCWCAETCCASLSNCRLVEQPEVAGQERVTFDEQPEIKRVCNHDALIDTGVGYDVCPICNSSFPHIEPEAAGQEQEAVDHANRILFSNLKYQIGNIFTEKFLEHNDGKFHTALELNPAIHAVTEFVFEKIKQQKPWSEQNKTAEREKISITI